MNITSTAKRQLCEKSFESVCCKIASLSAFVRTAGSVITEKGVYGFSVNSKDYCLDYYADILRSLYDVEPVFTLGKNAVHGFSVVCEKSVGILCELGIFTFVDGQIIVSLEPDSYLTENDCCKKAYLIGAFLGGGSITVPDEDGNSNTGYHFETVFSKYLAARHFCSLLAECGFMPKLIERGENYVVYFKQHEEIKELLTFFGCDEAVKSLDARVALREIRNNSNRANNCDIYNLGKQVDASIKYRSAIEIIEQTIGLNSLKPELKVIAEARKVNPDATLTELSEELGISKSCLNHRLRKLVEIAEQL